MAFNHGILLSYTPTPLQEIRHDTLDRAGIQLQVKREDLNHYSVSGNKWWKLKYNLEEVMRSTSKTILTFGGAYSNHIFATAAAAHELTLKSIGIIRGEETLPLNDTLQFAIRHGMVIRYISRDLYRRKMEAEFLAGLKDQHGDFYMIPEGGTNALAVKGCAEFATKYLNDTPYDYLMLPVGTGGTMAGLICGLKDTREIIGVSVLKNGEFLKDDISALVKNFCGQTYGKWSLLTSYHHGGYAKVTEELGDFIAMMGHQHNLPMDSVYMGKLLWAVMQEAKNGSFKRGSTVLALHTGGLQGRAPMISA